MIDADLVAGQEPVGEGDLAVVDCSEDGEDEEGRDDVDGDLDAEPELGAVLVAGDHVEGEEKGGAGQGQEAGQQVGQVAQGGQGHRGREEPGRMCFNAW